MPTRISTVVPPAPQLPPMAMPPASLTLLFGGVQFSLTPKNTASQLSYKTTADGRIVLDLDNFTGTLQVLSTTTPLATASPSSISRVTGNHTTNNKTVKVVVDEPNSPEYFNDSHNNLDDRNTVTPGQQRLSFQTKSKNPKKTTAVKAPKPKDSKKDKAPRKRSNDGSNASSKKSRQDGNERSSSPPLRQHSMEIPTQMEGNNADDDDVIPDLSQTMPSQATKATSLSTTSQGCNNDDNDDDDDNRILKNAPFKTTPPNGESVQDILNRVNSSNDSVTDGDNDGMMIPTYKDDDDDKENFLASSPSANSSQDVAMDETPVQSNTTVAAVTDTMVPIAAAATVDTTTTTTPLAYPAPCPRWGHTMTQLKDDRLLIYGGQSFDLQGNPTILSDVHVYNAVQRAWEKPINCRGEARQWHSATFLPERQLLLAFGGETTDILAKKNKNKVITSDSLKVLDTEIMLWYPPAVSGDVPTGRSGHTATLIPSTNEVVLFGGVKGSKWLNTVTILDTVRWIWSTPKILGAAPKPRSYHSTTAVPHPNHENQYKLVVFGGNNKTSCFNTVHVLEVVTENVSNNNKDDATTTATTTWKWSHPSVQGQAPFPRTGHTATLMEDGKTLCIHGGWDPNEPIGGGDDKEGEDAMGEENIFKSSFLLDTETWTWSKGPKSVPGGSGSEAIELDNCGPKRCGHTASMHPETGDVVVFGGRVPGERLAGDFQRLVTEQQDK